MDSVSVIIPAYNASERLGACLAALQSQTQPPDEIIVVDDGSKDDTDRVARENGAMVFRQSHQGAAVARNLGIHHASGEIVLFTDADCIPATTWVAEMVHPFSDPDVTGVKGSYLTTQSENVALLVQYEFEERYDRQEKLACIDVVDSYSAGFRLGPLKEAGGFDPSFSHADEDVELSYRLQQSGCRLVFNRRAVVYHHHPRAWIDYFRRKVVRGYWRIMAYRLYPGKAFRDSYTPQLLKLQIALVFLFLLFCGLTFFFRPFWIGVVMTGAGFILSTFPFMKRIRQKDKALLLPGLFFIFIRSFALGLGTAGALCGFFFFRPSLLRKKNSPEAVLR